MSSVSFALTSLIAFGAAVALLIVSLTVVRKSRPDAAGVLIASGALQAVIVVGRGLSYLVLPLVASQYGGASAVMALNAALGLGWALLGAFAMGLLIAGVYRLARPV